MTHPFIDRLRSEREVLDAVNKAVPDGQRPLVGLAPREIRRWLQSLDEADSATLVQLEQQLVHIGRRIRSRSTTSHRGVVWEPSPTDNQFQRELQMVTQVIRAFKTPRQSYGEPTEDAPGDRGHRA